MRVRCSQAKKNTQQEAPTNHTAKFSILYFGVVVVKAMARG